MKALSTSRRDNCIQLGLHTYPIAEIVMLEASANYTFLHLRSGQKLIFAKTIKSFESLCHEFEFLRIHRSFIINSTHLKGYYPEDNYVTLQNNLKATISRRRKVSLDYFLFLQKKRFQHIFAN